jgi:aspartyl aminopeptidase
MQSLLQADGEQTCMLVCNDHEEVGSASACGAQGPMFASVLERLWPDAEQRFCIIDRSMMISADNAHGIHPNFPSRHDNKHGPLLNAGPVIKVNSNQRYATNNETSAIFRKLCQPLDIAVQTFVSRADMGCGSTIGPITATTIGVRTLDIGVPSFAMHSVRELAGRQDCYALHRVFNGFFGSQAV